MRKPVKSANSRQPYTPRDTTSPKYLARTALQNAVGRGALVRGDVCAFAERRDCKGTLEAHHPSYEPSEHLNVIWLCRSHHKRVHHWPDLHAELIAQTGWKAA